MPHSESPTAEPVPTPTPPPRPTPAPESRPTATQESRPTPTPQPRPAATRPPTLPSAGSTEATAVPPVGGASPAETPDPSTWGRVDDEGNVWAKTPSGERRVGAYPGASPTEALAYFARKYDDLAAQVQLLEQRMRAGGVAGKEATTLIERLRAAVAEGNAVGDLEALTSRLDVLAAKVAERKKEADARRARAREQAQVRKTELVVEAESLAESSDWKKSGDRMRALLDEWKAAPRLDRKVDEELWKRFSRARTRFDKRRAAHFAELDVTRAENAERKEKLVKEAEALASSTDWAATAARYRELMTQWKSLGRARRDVEDALWERFKAAQDAFFAARNTTLAVRDADLKQNLEKKETLLAEAEALLPVGEPRAARRVMRAIAERWEAVGPVPRADRDRVEHRLKNVDDAIRVAEESAWKRSNPEARARAQAAVTQLRRSIEQYEAEAAAARHAGQQGRADKADAAAAARREWLVEAERTFNEFS